MGRALIWWSTQVKDLSVEKAKVTPWEKLKKQMLREFHYGEDVTRAEHEFNHLSK